MFFDETAEFMTTLDAAHYKGGGAKLVLEVGGLLYSKPSLSCYTTYTDLYSRTKLRQKKILTNIYHFSIILLKIAAL